MKQPKTARKQLTSKVKKKIVDLAIKGKSDNEIIQILQPISQSSVSRVKKSNQDLIAEKKEKYIKLIDRSTGGDSKQADILADILTAETEVYNFKGEVVGTRPDHKLRLDAIKYIDKLKGREVLPTVKATQNNLYIGQTLDRYIK